VTPVEFRGDLWHQKTRFPGLSCGVVYVILRLAVLVELRLVTDRHRQTQGHSIYRGCIASGMIYTLTGVEVNLMSCVVITTSTAASTLHPFNGLFSRTTWVSRYQKGKTSLDLNEARGDKVLGCSGISWTICKEVCSSCQSDNHMNTSSLNFYQPDAFPDAQPTVSKHYRH